uniref:Uncharacterized protein n=1 Tax=Janibacter limosus TaxID=53458 RepID=A0AC61U1K1_9MICO|nr:hypothetical protein [Janibacter limosus]
MLVSVADAREIAVVGDVEVPEGVHSTLEDPPRVGPWPVWQPDSTP